MPEVSFVGVDVAWSLRRTWAVVAEGYGASRPNHVSNRVVRIR